jgi:hypothetical protein
MNHLKAMLKPAKAVTKTANLMTKTVFIGSHFYNFQKYGIKIDSKLIQLESKLQT